MERIVKPGELERKYNKTVKFAFIYLIFALLEFFTKEGTTVNNIFTIVRFIFMWMFIYNLVSSICMIIEYHIKIERHEATEYLAEQEAKTQGTTTDDLKP
jgi:hypothetical protein